MAGHIFEPEAVVPPIPWMTVVAMRDSTGEAVDHLLFAIDGIRSWSTRIRNCVTGLIAFAFLENLE